MRGTVKTDTRIATVHTISDSFKRQEILCVHCFVFSKNDIISTLVLDKFALPGAPLPGRPCNYFDDRMVINYRGAYLKVAQLFDTNKYFLQPNRITYHPLILPV